MRTVAIGLTTILVLASGSFGPANADSAKLLLVPGYEAAKDLWAMTTLVNLQFKGYVRVG